MSKLETNTIDTVSGTTNLTIGSTNTSTITVPNGKLTGQNYPSFRAYRASAQNISGNTETKVPFDTENFDTDNTYDNSTNYRFTPGVSGKYFVFNQVCCTATASNALIFATVIMKKNGSEIARNTVDPHDSYRHNQAYPFFATVVDMNTTDYIEIFINADVNSGSPQIGDGSNQTYFGAYRIGS